VKQKLTGWLQRGADTIRRRPVLLYTTILVLLAIVSHWQWFNPHSILEYGDWQYRPDESVREQVSSWMTWVPFNNVGSANVLMSGFPLRGLAWGIITQIGLTYDIATKLTLFLPVALGGFLIPFWVGRRWFKHDLIAFVTAVFYGTTAYYLTLQTGHLPIAIIYAILPYIVWRLDIALRVNALRDWLLLALMFCVGIFYEVRIMYIVACVLILYMVMFICLHPVRIRSYIKHISIAGLFIAFANVFWLLPTKMAAAQGIDDIAGRGLFGDGLFNLQQSFAVMKWSWTGQVIDRTFTAQPVPAYLFIIPIIICICLVFANKYRRQLLFFLVLTAIGFLLTKQSTEPFATLYEWLYNNFPGFILFREASKFYIVTAFGYFGLLGYGLLGLKDYRNTLRSHHLPFVFYAAIAGVFIVAGLNLVPAVNTSLGNTFKNAQMPADYVKLKKFINDQPDFFRTYWVPRDSWWGFYDNTHPKVRAVDILNQDWKALPINKGSGSGYDLAQSTTAVFSQPYSADLLRNASVKYVIVPLRDTVNDDDFFGSYGDDKPYFTNFLDSVSYLKKVDIGTRDVAIYENIAYRPYISAGTGLYQGNETMLMGLAGSVVNTKDHETTASSLKTRAGKTAISSIFANDDKYTVQASHAVQEIEAPQQSVVSMSSDRRVDYQVKDGILQFSSAQEGTLTVNGQQHLQAEPTESLGEAEIAPKQQYYLGIKDALVELPSGNTSSTLGYTSEQIDAWKVSKANLISNASFIDGLWTDQVKDCNPYDDKGQVNIILDPVGSNMNKNSLQLSAFNHTACTGQSNMKVDAGKTYLFGFDYRVIGGQKAGYSLTFDDPAKTIIRQDMTTPDKNWHTFTKKIVAPAGAKHVSLELYGYPEQSRRQFALTNYDKFRLSAMTSEVSIPAIDAARQTTQLAQGKNVIRYDATKPFTNVVPNPSLEQGLWRDQVSDCNAYDANPDIGMRLDSTRASDGRKSLQLSARRHTACTSTKPITVTQNSTYRLSFDYASSSASDALYSVRFNDPAGTTVQEGVEVKGSKWHTYNTEIKVPLGATRMIITLKAEPNSASAKRVHINYDNIRFVDISAISNRLLTISEPVGNVVAPKKIAFDVQSPTRKKIQVTGAKTGFYLIMNEAYHPGWRLEIDDAKVNGTINSWRPGVHPRGLKAAEHFEANIAMNGWYVDVDTLCKHHSACIQNADGSYNLSLLAEFAPQRTFYGGLVISVATFGAAVAYVIGARNIVTQRKLLRRKWWHRKKKASEGDIHV